MGSSWCGGTPLAGHTASDAFQSNQATAAAEVAGPARGKRADRDLCFEWFPQTRVSDFSHFLTGRVKRVGNGREQRLFRIVRDRPGPLTESSNPVLPDENVS